MALPTFGLWYDFRNPLAGRTNESFYAATLEQIGWAEGLGIESVWLSEHHFCDDGYTPSPLVIAAAIYVCFAYADRVQRLLGPGGTDVAVRLSAFILFCLGIQILWSGGSELLQSVMHPPPPVPPT